MQQYSGTVVDGGLKLDKRIGLSDNSRVRVIVLPVSDAQVGWHQALDGLRELKQSRPLTSGGLK